MFFSLPSWAVALILFGVIGAATIAGYATGNYLREHEAKLREPFGVLQAALLGVVGLILAFGLTLAVGRYEDRRAAMVAEANAIGTTYLRAELIAEPARSRSLELLRRYTDLALQVSREVPGSDGMRRTTAAEGVLQRRLWRRARARGLRRRGSARAARTAHLDPRSWLDPDARRCGARDAVAARDLRPRPPDAGADRGPVGSARRGACRDGAASCSAGAEPAVRRVTTRQVKALTALATISPNSASATVDCTSIVYFARCVRGMTSVGLNAVALVKPRWR